MLRGKHAVFHSGFLRTEDAVESLIFGLVTYIFVYALYLIETLEQPFRKGQGSLDDVSLFLLREFADKLDSLKKLCKTGC